MTQEEIVYLFNNSPAMQMMRLRNASWVLPFLHFAFKEIIGMLFRNLI